MYVLCTLYNRIRYICRQYLFFFPPFRIRIIIMERSEAGKYKLRSHFVSKPSVNIDRSHENRARKDDNYACVDLLIRFPVPPSFPLLCYSFCFRLKSERAYEITTPAGIPYQTEFFLRKSRFQIKEIVFIQLSRAFAVLK